MTLRWMAMAVGLGLVLLSGCGTAHTARPLGQGNTAVNVSFGGPVADIGAMVPVPMPTIGVKHGVTERADLFATWHVLPLAMGVGMFDLGGSYYVLEQNKGRPGMSVAGSMLAAFDDQNSWAAVDLQYTASWLLHPRHLIYLGFHVLFAPLPESGVETPPVHFAPLLGGEVRLGPRQRFGLGLELKWGDPWAETEMMIVDYMGSQGAFSICGGFNFYLGDGAERRARRQGGGEP